MEALQLEGLLLLPDVAASRMCLDLLIDMVIIVSGAFEVVAEFIHNLDEHADELFLLRCEELSFEFVH